MNSSFYSEEELKNLGLKCYGSQVLISKKASIYFPGGISLGNNVRVDDFCILSGKISFGSNIHISAYTALFAGSPGIVVEDFATISSGVVIYGKSDDYSGEHMTNPTIPNKYTGVVEGEVKICKHAIIGARTVIFPNVVIEAGVAVGAMSLVNKDLKEWGIYAGIPCRFLKRRSKKILSYESEYLASQKYTTME